MLITCICFSNRCSIICCCIIFIIMCFTSYIKPCHADDPQINQCFINAAKELQKRMSNGIPELLIPPMNPLILPKVNLDHGQNFKATFRDIEIFKADTFNIENLNVDLPKNHVDMKLSFETLRIRSKYEVEGRLLVLDLKGKGLCDGNYTNVVADLMIDGSRYMKNGKEYLKFESKSLSLDLGKIHLWFDNIFGDNEELNQQTNKLINENIQSLMVELKPVIDDAVTQFVFALVNRIFERYSFDELFPK